MNTLEKEVDEGVEGAEGDSNGEDDEGEFKKPTNTKRRRRKGCSFSNSRRHSNNSSKRTIYSCLSASYRDCTWLENTDKNIKLLKEKNKE